MSKKSQVSKQALRLQRNKVPYEFLTSLGLMVAVILIALFIMIPRDGSIRYEKPGVESEQKLLTSTSTKSLRQRSGRGVSGEAANRTNAESKGQGGQNSPAGASDDMKEANVRISEAMTHVDSGEWEKAEAILKDILKNDPRNEHALIELAVIQIIDKQDSQAAIPYLEQVLQLNPDNEEAMHELVTTYGELGKNDEGLAYLKSFADQHPESTNAQFGVARALYESDRVDEANDAMDRLIGRVPSDKAFRYTMDRADMNANLGRDDEALKSYAEALARSENLSPEAASDPSIQDERYQAMMNMALIKQRQGRSDEAHSILERLERESPQGEWTSALRAQMDQEIRR